MTEEINIENELTKKEKIKYGIILGVLSIFTLVSSYYVNLVSYGADFYILRYLLLIFFVFFLLIQIFYPKNYIIKSSTMFTCGVFVLLLIIFCLFYTEYCTPWKKSWNCKFMFKYGGLLFNIMRGYTLAIIFLISFMSFILLFTKEYLLISLKGKKLAYFNVTYIVLLFIVTFLPLIYYLATGNSFLYKHDYFLNIGLQRLS